MTEIEFVDDWSPLKEAINILSDPSNFGEDHGEFDCNGMHHSEDVSEAIWVVKRYVPALIEQYSKLLELSFMLTEAWDMANQNKTPSGLIVEEFKL